MCLKTSQGNKIYAVLFPLGGKLASKGDMIAAIGDGTTEGTYCALNSDGKIRGLSAYGTFFCKKLVSSHAWCYR